MNFWEAIAVMLNGHIVKDGNYHMYKILNGVLYTRSTPTTQWCSTAWKTSQDHVHHLSHPAKVYETCQEQLTWHEAVQAMKDGKKVSRPGTSDYYVVLKSGRFIYAKQTNTHWFTNFNLTLEHLEATDWVVVD